MNKILNSVSILFAAACGIPAAVFGEWDRILWALAALMTLDYLSGIVKAVYTKSVSSEIGYKGILKKITMLLIVALANIVQEITGGAVAVRELVIMFYIANEGISILENAAAVMPNMPEKLKEILLQIRSGDDERG